MGLSPNMKLFQVLTSACHAQQNWIIVRLALQRISALAVLMSIISMKIKLAKTIASKSDIIMTPLEKSLYVCHATHLYVRYVLVVAQMAVWNANRELSWLMDSAAINVALELIQMVQLAYNVTKVVVGVYKLAIIIVNIVLLDFMTSTIDA